MQNMCGYGCTARAPGSDNLADGAATHQTRMFFFASNTSSADNDDIINNNFMATTCDADSDDDNNFVFITTELSTERVGPQRNDDDNNNGIISFFVCFNDVQCRQRRRRPRHNVGSRRCDSNNDGFRRHNDSNDGSRRCERRRGHAEYSAKLSALRVFCGMSFEQEKRRAGGKASRRGV